MAIKSSKLFEVLDINLSDKYKTDLFFRTTCHIVALQALLIAIMIVVFWYSLDQLGRGITAEFVSNLQTILAGGQVSGAEFTQDLRAITLERFIPAAIIVMAVTLIFGFIMAYIALTPTRRSLDRKKQFVSNIAHELRTPLAIVRTNTDVALLDEGMPRHLRKTLTNNIHELDRASEIMNNLLSLSNVMNAGNVPFTAVDLATVAQNARKSLTGLSNDKEIRLKIEQKTTEAVNGNSVALEQVAFNLMKNGITYSPAGGTLTVTIEPGRGSYVDLIVADTGVGIPHSELLHVFEPFYRSKRAPKGEGSGLGLAIVSEIVRMHRGRITVESVKGQGTTVRVSIPRLSTERPLAVARDAQQKNTYIDEVGMDFTKELH